MARAATRCPASSSSSGGSPAVQALPAATVSSTYTLSPYDVIDVSVYNEEDLQPGPSGEDGTALLPLIGTFLSAVNGGGTNELIRKRYAQGFVKDPRIW